MANYVKDPEKLKERIREAYAYSRDQKAKDEIRKNRELLRRRVHAALYEPKPCLGDPITGEPCLNYSIPGAAMCEQHGGTTMQMQRAARTRLLYLVEPALRVMNKAMASNDLNIAVKAAQIILDRSGFHPSATLEIKDEPQDLSKLSTDQLKARAQRLLTSLEHNEAPEQPRDEDAVIEIVEEDQADKPDGGKSIH